MILRVAPSGQSVSYLKINFGLRCKHGRHLNSWVSAKNFAISDLRFGGRLRDREGETYKLAGLFSTTGSARGTFRTTWHSARYGSCRSGLVHWKAH